jgi:transposase-like protein
MPGKVRSTEEKFNIVMESLITNTSNSEICRKYGVSVSMLYRWKDQFLEGAKEGLLAKIQAVNLKER